MPETSVQKQEGMGPNSEGRIVGLDFLKLLTKWRRFILINLAVIGIGAAIISLILPPWYSATTSILPPKEQGATNPLGAASALLRGVGSSLQRLTSPSGSTGAYNYLAILKSRSVLEGVVRKFDLMHVYGISDTSIELGIKELVSHTTVEVQNEDYITISVEDKDRTRSAEMANYFVALLNEVSNRLGTQEAHDNRVFIQQRVDQIYERLHRAEDSLRNFQQTSPILVAPDESGGSSSSIAELYALKAKKEIEIGLLERTVSADNPLLLQSSMELKAIEKKVSEIPEAGLMEVRLLREVMIQQRILEYVLPLLEQAKVDEQKNVPVILVLDRAVPPEFKDRPKRSLIVIVAGLSAILLSIAYALAAEWFLRLRLTDPERYALWLNLFRKRVVR
jgi:uncharacterized protein involved in exopolysaccharide biosynthesis